MKTELQKNIQYIARGEFARSSLTHPRQKVAAILLALGGCPPWGNRSTPLHIKRLRFLRAGIYWLPEHYISVLAMCIDKEFADSEVKSYIVNCLMNGVDRMALRQAEWLAHEYHKKEFLILPALCAREQDAPAFKWWLLKRKRGRVTPASRCR